VASAVPALLDEDACDDVAAEARVDGYVARNGVTAVVVNGSVVRGGVEQKALLVVELPGTTRQEAERRADGAEP
jgi:hypothetical protein